MLIITLYECRYNKGYIDIKEIIVSVIISMIPILNILMLFGCVCHFFQDYFPNIFGHLMNKLDNISDYLTKKIQK